MSLTQSVSENLTLGEGDLYVAPFAAGTQTPTGERLLGHTTQVSVNVQGQRLDHKRSNGGVKLTDKSVMLDVTRSGTIVTDDMGADNQAMFALGIVQNESISSATNQTETISDVSLGLYYQIGVTASNPEGTRKITNAVLKVGTTSMVEGTDYEIDLTAARFRLLPGASNVADDDDVIVTYDQSAATVERIVAGAEEFEGTLRWVPAYQVGENKEYFFPYVRISPNGDLNLMASDNWANMTFTVTVLIRDNLPPWIITGQPV